MNRFEDRQQAGRLLARYLKQNFQLNDPVVLGLPRGGVIVAREVAQELGAPFDVVVTKKIGAPENPEYAIAAVDEDGQITTMGASLPLPFSMAMRPVERAAVRALAEVQRRTRAYRNHRQRIDLAHHDTIIVDDGIATGLTVAAAVRNVRARDAGRIIVAAPIASQQAMTDLCHLIDEVVVLKAPHPFHAVSFHYTTFAEVTDAQVLRALDQTSDYSPIPSTRTR